MEYKIANLLFTAVLYEALKYWLHAKLIQAILGVYAYLKQVYRNLYTLLSIMCI